MESVCEAGCTRGTRKRVSIPFKREGAWKDEEEYNVPEIAMAMEFQFPSNGKEHGKRCYI